MSARALRWAPAVVGALALALTCVAPARVVRAADLLGTVRDALDRDATLAASRDAQRAAQWAVPKARAALLPQVQGGWGRTYNGIRLDGYPAVHYWQNGWTVALTQPLFNWARWNTWRQADHVAARGELEAASAVQQTILRTAQAYFDTLAAEDELARARDYLAALDAHLALLRRAKTAGEATLVDLGEAGASRAQAQFQQLDAQSRLQLARLALERLTGKRADPLARLPEDGVLPALQPLDVAQWVEQAQTQGYPVQIREVALRIAKYDTEKARAGHYPSVDLQLTHTPAGAAAGYSRPTTTNTAMLMVTIPLFSGGETRAQVGEARALEDKARDELEAAVRDAAADARDGYLRVVSGRERVVSLEQFVQAARAALDATRIGYRTGSRTNADVVRATDSFYASRRDLIRARYDTVLALLKLLADTAMLDLGEVERINARLFARGDGGEREVTALTETGVPVEPAPPQPLAAARRNGGGASRWRTSVASASERAPIAERAVLLAMEPDTSARTPFAAAPPSSVAPALSGTPTSAMAQPSGTAPGPAAPEALVATGVAETARRPARASDMAPAAPAPELAKPGEALR